MGALLVSVKTDWTALRQGTDFRLPETAGNIIFHLGPETSSFAPEQEQIIFFFLASTKRTAETPFSLSHSATPDPAQLNAGKGKSILAKVFAREV